MSLAQSSRRLISSLGCARIAALGRARDLNVSAAPREEAESESVIPRLVVFGGRGFVGSHICKEALGTGLHVVGISKSGTPPISGEPWIKDVEWIRGNVLEPQTYAHHLKGAVAAISCVGAFGSQEQMLRINGTANVTAVETCKAAGVPRFVFISATIPAIPGLDYLIGGYTKGKKAAEEAVLAHYPTGGVVLRPGVVYGNRVVSHTVTLPLGYLFGPLEMALSQAPASMSSLPIIGGLLVPPVAVEVLARAAVNAATSASVSGVLGVPEIRAFK
ncbi:hypothetical protein FOA52_012915 [Chlamydomonas sp. UWO 241]|nr:hypothetical protein FOA52_012915 [Chlamydomonas sp. UWO 241]